MALVGLTVTLAPTIGPTVGGYLTELFSWHWLFLVNVVPGIAATVIAWTMVDFDKPDLGLLRALRLRRRSPAWRSSSAASSMCSRRGRRTTGSRTAASSSSASPARVGARRLLPAGADRAGPIVDLRAFRDRNFAVGSLLTFVLGIGLYGLTYLYPLFLARVRGYTALRSARPCSSPAPSCS